MFDFEMGSILFFSSLIIGIIADFIREYCVKSYTRIGRFFAIFIDTKLTFVGVIHHELSHAILAFIVGAKIEKISLFNIFAIDGTLGSVSIIPRGPWIIRKIQLCLSAIGPVLIGSVTLYLIYVYQLSRWDFGDWKWYIFFVLTLQIAYHMSMSRQDLKVAIWGLPIIYLLICFVVNFFSIDLKSVILFYLIVSTVLSFNFGIALIIRIIKN